jgi:hypothetical protein
LFRLELQRGQQLAQLLVFKLAQLAQLAALVRQALLELVVQRAQQVFKAQQGPA